MNVLEQLTQIFRDVLEDDEITLSDDTTAEDIDDWDSLNHMNLMLSIEKKLGVKFSNKQIAELQNVGDLIQLIQKKIVS